MTGAEDFKHFGIHSIFERVLLSEMKKVLVSKLARKHGLESSLLFINRDFGIYLMENREPAENVSILPHCIKSLAIFPSPAGMLLTKLSLVGKNLNTTCQGKFG